MTVDTNRVREYVDLKLRIRGLQATLDDLTKQADDMESELLDQFMKEGVQNIKADNGTAFLRSQIWASYPDSEERPGTKDYETTNAALRMAGLHYYVKERFNAIELSAYVRELPRDELDNPILPPELEGKLAVVTKFKLVVLKR